MSIVLNGTTISRGAKPVINDTEIEKIIFNGSTVWEHDTSAHSAPLSCVVATSKTAEGSFVDEGTRIRREEWVHYDGMGVSVNTWVRYIGYIDLTQLPDWQDIKRVVIQHPRYAEDGRDGGKYEWRDVTTTHTVNAGDTKVEFNDYDYRYNDSNGASIGADIGVRAWAGVRYITYYYV